MKFDYELTDQIGQKANFGIIVLSADETLEHEFQQIFDADGFAFYISRVESAAHVTHGNLAQIEDRLSEATALFPPTLRFDTLAFACTSAASVIGSNNIASAVGRANGDTPVTDPLDAIISACRRLGVSKPALLSPYIADVSDGMIARLAEKAITVSTFGSFEESSDAKVARIDPYSIKKAAIRLGSTDNCDAVIISCTNLRTLDIIGEIETTIGKPVISSNQALAWRMLQLAKVQLPKVAHLGQLFDVGRRLT